MMVWVATSADAIATALTYHQYQSSSFLPRAVCPHPSSSITDSYSPQTLDFQPPNPLFTPSPLLILGALAVFFGASLRLWCFHALGRLFTFEVTIHPTHTLVTSGPYAFVRHPSYTGAILAGTGAALAHLSHGSWVMEGLDLHGLGIQRWWISVGGACLATSALVPRMNKEDKMLKEHFGNVWEKWRKDVPYRLVPGVY